jgi:hypothetical protein
MSPDTSNLIKCLCRTFIQSDRAKALQQAVSDFKGWDAFLHEATHHRLLPIAYWTFKRHQVVIPRKVNLILAGAYLQQACLAKAQNAAMNEILRAFTELGIDALVLKGGVLAHLIYPEPGLRPMEDIDILVSPDQLGKAHEVLSSKGYSAPLEKTRYDRLQHQMPIAHRKVAGHIVCIELHRELFNRILNCTMDFSHLERPFAQIQIDGVNVNHLGEAELLWMQYRGLRKLAEPLRQIQLIDIALLAERMPDHWQGPSVRMLHSELWNALVALDQYIPFSQRTRQFLGIPIQKKPDAQGHLGQDYSGWPRVLMQRHWADWVQTLWPKRWWAHFFYGLAPDSTRWQIQRSHWALFVLQGWRRLKLGPVNPHSFFALKHHAIQTPIYEASEDSDSVLGLLVKSQPSSDSVQKTAPEMSQEVSDIGLKTVSVSQKQEPLDVVAVTTVLVTCMYNGLSETCFGGRNNRDKDYRESLATIARSSDLPIICFVSAEELPIHQSFFEGRPHHITWVTLELKDIPHSNEIQKIKFDHSEDYTDFYWKQRCVEIMWGKFHMLELTFKIHESAKHLFWIDAGLANVNIISTKYTDAEALAAFELHRVDSAFTPQLFEGMKEMAGDRFLAIKTTQPHNPGIPEKYNDYAYTNSHGLIGGLFGGNRQVTKKMCQLFEAKCQKILATDVLYGEENIMTGLLADHPELFETFTFNSWYHEGWSFHNPELVNFSQFFDLMLKTPEISHPVKFPWGA